MSYSQTSCKQAPEMSSLGDRSREVVTYKGLDQPYWVKILIYQYMVAAETYHMF